MQKFKIITDFGCDLPRHLIEAAEIEIIPTNLHIEGEHSITTDMIEISDFYAKLRQKKMIRTSAISIGTFEKHFGATFAEGSDIIYIGMSSGLSGTFGAAKVAADTLHETYPERRIAFIDTHSGCGGEGLAAYLAAQKKAEGADFDETCKYMQSIAPRISSWFMADDLFFLKRGGRLRTATAVVGSLLMIKPIIGVNEEGKLVAVEKARGRKGAMEALIKKIETLCEDPKNTIITISHSDCMGDAVNLEMAIRAKWDVKDIIITDIGPAFGAHCGPDTIAVFFLKDETTEEETATAETEQ
ncbi:MAG: DegV family protein [Clostridia bacterium]|nr:DegV family protein [Clostridia bacterium]